MNKVRRHEKKRIRILNGKEIPISRASYNESRNRYLI